MKTKMKKLTDYNLGNATLIVFLFALLVVSCEDLPLDTRGELAAEEFFSSIDDIESGTLGVYSVLADKMFANSENFCHLWAADDRTTLTGSNKGFFLEYDTLDPEPTNVWQNNGWRQLWTIVGAANTFLDNEERMQNIVAGGNEELLGRSLGEVRFLRALAYFEIVRTWGEVPLLTSAEGITGLEEKATFQELYDVIIADLIFAKENLGPEPVNGIYRADFWMAQSLLANVYLTTAGFPLKNTSNYALAAAEAKNVIDNGPHDLVFDYADGFGSADVNLSANGNPEAVIAFPANPQLDGWNAGNFEAETIGFDDKWVEFAFFEAFPEGRRKEFTFDEDPDNPRPRYSAVKFGPQDFAANRDIKYFRFAELLLIHAEAQIRATGNNSDPGALQSLNRVRERAGLNAVTSATWEDVVWEKAWETAGEWSRWYDIVRTETLEEVKMMRSPIDNALTPLGSDLTEQDPWAKIPANDASANPNLLRD